MAKLRWVALVMMTVLAVGFAFVAHLGAHRVDPAELAGRCEQSQPAWNSYQEDIKGQVGAQSVALWRGQLVEVGQTGPTVVVSFQLDPPWADWEAAVPVLLRDPYGNQYRQTRVEKEGALRRYLFQLDAQAGTSFLPWIEVHFPHTERHIALNPDGHWKNDGPSRSGT